ncbi:uncharacterized protein LOC113215131 isoform X2 [Frankliniella occidentalis]|uniref:Uncharacterized protein LOC113215131 isoform X2 n=2 Tax=Frankliniella occidentalis TaxID=133901 RepID=A0A9C6U7C4_FRAOC|nr:uncharacterized protein LOC113215131 isoform X2 [Frankliniella occidentalis]
MIDLELPGVGVRLGVHNDALLRLPRRTASSSNLPPSRCSVSVLPPSGPVHNGVHSPTRRRCAPSSSSSSSPLPRRRHRHHHHQHQQHQQQQQHEVEEQEEDPQRVLKLSLRKPGAWQWQVHTSASSPALLVPAVQLYDHRGRLLLDTSSSSASVSKSSSYRSDAGSSPWPGGSGGGGQHHRRRRRHRYCGSGSGSSNYSGVEVDDAELAMAPALRSVPHAVPHDAVPLEGQPPAHCALVGEEAQQEALEVMGSSGSRPSAPGKPGLLGRRTQSSGSLCTGARAGDKLGRLLAPCGRHRHHRHCHNSNGTEDPRHHRYKLCGSLPNRLDAAQQDLDVCDNNNMTPASPAASEKDLQDLGYASERSPDDEKHFPGDMLGACESVSLQRGSRGLGLSVCGGVDCAPDGLVRIKRLFPHQPAWQSGRLRPGDVLLAVNGEPLSGLTNHEALEVLRTASDHVVLTVARPARPPSWAPPQQREHAPPQYLQLPTAEQRLARQDSCGELEVSLSKVQGSLGFTLRKEDSSALGHYVRALVREPALSDGRIRPGDKIVAVNGMDISHMTHEEAVLFLRQAGDTVHLRLYRDVGQTPVSALSPTEARPKTLRKEALDMLSDLAVRRLAPRPGESSTLGRPRKVADRPQPDRTDRAHASSQPSLQQQQQQQQQQRQHQRSRTQSFGERLSHRSQELISSSHTSREQSPLVDLADSTVSSSSLSSLASVVERPPGLRGVVVGGVRRPDFLELSERGGPGAAAPGWHLQRLTLTTPPAKESWADDGKSSDFASLPCNSPDERVRPGNNFSHRNRNPAFQSAHPTCRSHSPGRALGTLGHAQASHGAEGRDTRGVRAEVALQESTPGGVTEGRTGLLKWKGVVFTPEDDDSDTESSSAQDDTISQSTLEDSNGQVFTVELNRGWNSRLGFSLQSSGDYSVISAIYSDSVAAKNGKLKIGDRIIMVNDESVEGMATANVIDLFRKIRGSIAITVWREIKV